MALRHRLASGRWRTAHPGVYLTHTGPVTDAQRRWVAALAVGRDDAAPLGGLSALALLGLRGHPDLPIEVLVPATRQVDHPPPGVRVHRVRSLPWGRTGTRPASRPAPCQGAR